MRGELRQIARWLALCEARRRAAELRWVAEAAELRRLEREVEALAETARERCLRQSTALAAGELIEWRGLQLQAGASVRARELAVNRRAAQSARCAEAQQGLRERRLDAERAGKRFEERAQAERVESDRREQGRSDDRFAARRHWLDAHG